MQKQVIHVYNKILDLMKPKMDSESSRRGLITPVLSAYQELYVQIDWAGAARDFTTKFVETCWNYGEVEQGKHALLLVLESLHTTVGIDEQKKIDDIVIELDKIPKLLETHLLLDKFGNFISSSYADLLKSWLLWSNKIKEIIDNEELDNKLMLSEKNDLLEDIWDKFVSAKMWHEKLKELIEHYVKDLSKLDNQIQESLFSIPEIDNINWSENYSQILTNIRKLFTEETINNLLSTLQSLKDRYKEENNDYLRRLTSKLFDETSKIQRELQRPSFGRCLNLQGGLGTGKTHFALTRIPDQHSVSETKILVLPMEPPYKNESLRELILKRIQEATKIDWDSIEQFDIFLQNEQPEITRIESYYYRKNRLIIIFDDLERWSILKPNFFLELRNIISSTTKLHSLFWLLTLEDSSYYKIIDLDNFLFKYGFIFHRLERAYIGSWIVLDDINRQTSIGIKIIREALTRKGVKSLVAVDYIEEDQSFLQMVSQPFLAWILIALYDLLPIQSIVKLTYIEFVTLFMKNRLDRLDQLSKDEKLLAEQLVGFIAKYFCQTCNIKPGYEELVDYVTDKAKQISELQERQVVRKIMKTLEDVNLIRLFKTREEIPIKILQTRYDTFWEWRIARRFNDNLKNIDLNLEKFLVQAENWTDKVGLNNWAEGVIEFQLLLIDRELDEEMRNKLNESIWEKTLYSNVLHDSSVWLAGAKASIYIQKYLLNWSLNSQDLIKSATKRNFFTYMHFLGDISLKVINIQNRLTILKQHFDLIKKYDLNRYYYYLISKLLEKVADNEELLMCMPSLHGCEELGLAQELASISVNKLRRKSLGDVNKATDCIIKYLRDSCSNARTFHIIKGTHKEWKRHYYREWVLYEFTGFVINKLGLKAYEFFKKINWYRPDILGFGPPISNELEREANISFGFWYRNGVRRTRQALFEENENNEKSYRFIDLVTELTYSDNVRDMAIAFHLIRHTEATFGRMAVLVDKEFRPLLKKIYNAPGMNNLIGFHEFFKVNLKD